MTISRVHAFVTAVGCAAILAVTGCGSLTSVDDPDVLQAKDYESPSGASTLAIGAVRRMYEAFGNNGFALGYVMQSGLLADELSVTGINIVQGPQWDSRDIADPLSTLGGVPMYTALHRARINAATALRIFEQTAPDSTTRIGHMFTVMGYMELFLGESFCSGIPLSRLDEQYRPIYGAPLTNVEMLQRAEDDFDSALAYAADSSRIVNLAAIGKGRALLNLGDYTGAAQAVSDVPTDYRYDAVFGASTVTNGFYRDGTFNAVTVPEQEGANGLNWRTANDVRVPLLNRSPAILGNDGVTEVWVFVPYQSASAPIPIAQGTEARLIEAEAALQASDPTTWLQKLNDLRAGVAGLDPLVDPGTPDARVDLTFRERAFWLFLTGHRQGDLRRLVRQYGRDPETVYPTGQWRAGVAYGPATNMAPESTAYTNPNYTGCSSRDP